MEGSNGSEPSRPLSVLNAPLNLWKARLLPHELVPLPLPSSLPGRRGHLKSLLHTLNPCSPLSLERTPLSPRPFNPCPPSPLPSFAPCQSGGSKGRLKYLLAQTEIFQHFAHPQAAATPEKAKKKKGRWG